MDHLNVEQPLGLYLHIPFCAAKCRYCDFLSFPGRGEEEKEAYVQALLKQMECWGQGQRVDSVFIGGGTPSLLSGEQIGRILERTDRLFSLDPDAEITMEANPGTVTAESLRAYRAAGVNRLSLGVQSMDEGLLRLMGRIHSRGQAVAAVELARQAGFDNLSLDLIFALPGQTAAQWSETLQAALSLAPEHISFYALQIEEGTPFYKAVKDGSLIPTSDRLDREMYALALDMLQERGFRHYEISNAALPGFESRHNLKYWNMDPYIGLGLGAHSYYGGWRFSNADSLPAYIAGSHGWSEPCACPGPRNAKNALLTGFPFQVDPFIVFAHQNTLEDDLAEFMFTGLRKIEGISLSAFQKRFGCTADQRFPKALARHCESGLLLFEPENDRLRLSRKGLDLANTVMVDFV